ncbi:sensor histidine kinase [Arcanobacterium canis]|uniref:histidine kinase n=1 Tax=Arcanobacterium canis TaxID=999183 RepID=A0ABY8FWP6_9ACTO|nr:histidine kinase N-terminal domain-containing protein [Arcanobacterium canis]WFM82942.1 histidine kinase N-terminal domain-containing protein [Arcanobacterium canis]
MPTLTKMLERIPEFSQDDRDWLHRLIGDSQLLADLTFSDVLLVVHCRGQYKIAAQTRPATAATLYEYDVVGMPASDEVIEDLDDVYLRNKMVHTQLGDRRVVIVPVCRVPGSPIALLALMSAPRPDRLPSQAQLSYEDIANELLTMVRAGAFPVEGSPTGYRHGTPRVSDGVVHIDGAGHVLYMSPNAVSHFRRLGVDDTLMGSVLAEAVTSHIETRDVDESLPVVLMGRAAWMSEVESHGVVISLRAVPLLYQGKRTGAVILCRDITELRRQERELMTKDATIREINHRVKNNLQTVSALLRLQGRRATNKETADALANAQRRVSTIALVHERLSETIDEVVDFDHLFIPLMRLIRDAAVTDVDVRTTFTGSFGRVRAEQATALAVVMNEVLSNAIEHGLSHGQEDPRIDIEASRFGQCLVVTVCDNGNGIGEKGPGSGLGTQIVRTMVSGELAGSIQWSNRDEGGTEVTLTAKLRS